MVRLASYKDLAPLSELLQAMAKELMPEYATDDNMVYRSEVLKYLHDEEYHVYIDDRYRGFFMVKDDTEPVYPGYHRYIGTKVYIKDDYRGGRLLKQFYDKLFTDFKDGDIVGLTEIDSAHIPVLDKRHKLIAKVYLLNKEV